MGFNCGSSWYRTICEPVYLQGSGETEQNELYTFHEAVSQLQDAEEQLVECHKKSVEVCDTDLNTKRQ
jgi:hypothetical protein